jgi:hypothetical protein
MGAGGRNTATLCRVVCVAERTYKSAELFRKRKLFTAIMRFMLLLLGVVSRNPRNF